jgi:hypothetical protein
MAEAAWVCAAFVASYTGFAFLALRQKPHHSVVAADKTRAPLASALLQRNLALGSALLALSGSCCLLAQGPSFGSILWVLLLGAGAMSVLFTLSYRPHWLRPLWRATCRARPLEARH